MMRNVDYIIKFKMCKPIYEFDKDLIKDERDFYYWLDEYSSYSCFIMRNPELGFLCGYVEVPQDHPFSEKNYSEIEDEIDVHGCLTFSGKNFSNKWCFGFDCAHGWDLYPAKLTKLDPRLIIEGTTYKDVNFVTEECQKLARQLKDLEDDAK